MLDVSYHCNNTMENLNAKNRMFLFYGTSVGPLQELTNRSPEKKTVNFSIKTSPQLSQVAVAGLINCTASSRHGLPCSTVTVGYSQFYCGTRYLNGNVTIINLPQGPVETGAVPRGARGPRPPVKFLTTPVPPLKKKVQDKAATCLNFLLKL